jgi:hypothetical protein
MIFRQLIACGAALNFVGSSSVYSAISPSAAGFLDVTGYGATPDNASDDDAVAINKALQDAAGSGRPNCYTFK